MLVLLRRIQPWRACSQENPRRPLSTSALETSLQRIAHRLAAHQPCFAMPAHSIAIMHQPAAFYQCLLDMIRRAKTRLFISSLYIGSEELELIDALHTSLRRNPALRLHLHLDLNRSTRPGPQNTAHLLLPLLREFPDRVHVSLFRSPRLKGLLARIVPPRFNEGWGTWHPKIYGADDDVLISGANLNTSYFTNRQDRYIHFTAQPRFAQYCAGFLHAAAAFSYTLVPAPPSATHDQYALAWPDAHTHPHHTERAAHALLAAHQTAYRAPPNADPDASLDNADVLVFPVIQAGQFGIREEERCVTLLFDELARSDAGATPLVDFTSGYFGLYAPYQERILQCAVPTRIVAASPKANGFYGSRGFSGRIPEGYTLLEQRFMRAVARAGRTWVPAADAGGADGTGVSLSEWARDGWTYHAKGIWARPAAGADPYLTLFGSTNLNARSAELDTELSFMLLTRAPALRARLAAEVDGLRAHARPWRGGARPVRMGTHALVSVVGGML